MVGKKLIILTATLTAINSAAAYIDPGTGTAIAGSFWPLVVSFFAAIGAYALRYAKSIKNYFKSSK